MNSKKLFLLLCVGILVLCGTLIGGAYFANKKLGDFSKTLVDKRAKVAALEQQQSSLNEAKLDIEEYKDLANIARTIVPQDKDQAQTVREIVNIAAANEIKLASINFPSSTLGDIKAVTPSAGSTTPTGTSSPAQSTTSLSQLTPVKEIPGVYSLQIIVASDAGRPVSYGRFINFLDDLEHNRRTALVSSITITPDKENRGAISFTLTLDEYVKP